MEYHFLLARDGADRDRPAQRLLYANLRKAILQGRLGAGHRLPSSRDLAAELDLARNTVIYAFEQLCAEGYLLSSRRGTVVTAIIQPPPAARRPRPAGGSVPARLSGVEIGAPGAGALSFTPGVPALDFFPLAAWQATWRKTFREVRPTHLGYGETGGVDALREVISERLRAARGLRSTAGQVFITDGTQMALDLVSRALTEVGDVVCMENPGYTGARSAFVAAGLHVAPLSVDADGAVPGDVLSLTSHGKRPALIYVTPSHQYPLGSVMSLTRRMELLALARRLGMLILEDDYDSDFRFDGEPLPSLQGLIDDAPVLYLGTFSKTLFPGLRLGYVVVPAHLIATFHTAARMLARHGRQVEEMVLARFISEGRYTRHLGKMRRLYRERQLALRRALARHLPDLEVRGVEAGLHLVLMLPIDADDRSVCERARRLGMNPSPLSRYSDDRIAVPPALVLGYGNTSAESMERHVSALASCILG